MSKSEAWPTAIAYQSHTLAKVKAQLWVETDPKEAIIKILDLEAEFSQGLELVPGKHELEIAADGYKTLRKVVEVRAGEEKHLTIRLTALKPLPPLKPKPPGEDRSCPGKGVNQ